MKVLIRNIYKIVIYTVIYYLFYPIYLLKKYTVKKYANEQLPLISPFIYFLKYAHNCEIQYHIEYCFRYFFVITCIRIINTTMANNISFFGVIDSLYAPPYSNFLGNEISTIDDFRFNPTIRTLLPCTNKVNQLSQEDINIVEQLFKRESFCENQKLNMIYPLYISIIHQWFIGTKSVNNKPVLAVDNVWDFFILYGKTKEIESQLRTRDNGKLKVGVNDRGEITLPLLIHMDHPEAFNMIAKDNILLDSGYIEGVGLETFKDRYKHYFASGTPRLNSNPIMYTAVLYLVHYHNTLAEQIKQKWYSNNINDLDIVGIPSINIRKWQ